MKSTVKFEVSDNIIRIGAEIHGPRAIIIASLALDTGASTTMLNTEILRMAGYDPARGSETLLITGSTIPTARLLTIDRLDAAGQSVKNLEIVCHDLPDESELDGLLGLNFLCHFDLEINYSNATIVLKPLPST
jgi:predicted aspartyl protease